MEKSFTELVADSFSAFKKSFLASLGIAGIFIGFLIACGIIAALMVGRQALSGSLSNPSYILAYIPVFGTMFIIISFLYYVSFAWMVLVIRNNILVGQSFFKETFFEAVKKIFKIILLAILMFIVFIVIFFVCYMISPKFSPLLVVPFGLVLLPIVFTTSYGILCREGNFWDVISEGISLGFSRWFKIVWYAVCFLFCYVVIFFAVTYGVSSAFKVINLVTIGSIFTMIIQLCFMLFSYCFYTVFYLDLANVKPQQEIEVKETLDDIVLEQNIEQKPMQSSNDNQEPPHMEALK